MPASSRCLAGRRGHQREEVDDLQQLRGIVHSLHAQRPLPVGARRAQPALDQVQEHRRRQGDGDRGVAVVADRGRGGPREVEHPAAAVVAGDEEAERGGQAGEQLGPGRDQLAEILLEEAPHAGHARRPGFRRLLDAQVVAFGLRVEGGISDLLEQGADLGDPLGREALPPGELVAEREAAGVDAGREAGVLVAVADAMGVLAREDTGQERGIAADSDESAQPAEGGFRGGHQHLVAEVQATAGVVAFEGMLGPGLVEPGLGQGVDQVVRRAHDVRGEPRPEAVPAGLQAGPHEVEAVAVEADVARRRKDLPEERELGEVRRALLAPEPLAVGPGRRLQHRRDQGTGLLCRLGRELPHPVRVDRPLAAMGPLESGRQSGAELPHEQLVGAVEIGVGVEDVAQQRRSGPLCAEHEDR